MGNVPCGLPRAYPACKGLPPWAESSTERVCRVAPSSAPCQLQASDRVPFQPATQGPRPPALPHALLPYAPRPGAHTCHHMPVVPGQPLRGSCKASATAHEYMTPQDAKNINVYRAPLSPRHQPYQPCTSCLRHPVPSMHTVLVCGTGCARLACSP